MNKATIILISVLVITLLFLSGFLIRVIMFPAHSIDRGIDMAYNVTDDIMTSENAIYNYEWFKKQEGSIEALYQREKRAKDELDNFLELFPDQNEWNREQNSEYSRLSSNVTAVGNRLDGAIEDYNARSSMASRNIFKDNLPSNISRAYFAGRELRN